MRCAMNREDNLNLAKKIVKLVSSGLVELFTGAFVADVLNNVSGNKVSKFGARIGGGLIGLAIGDKVGDYVCDCVDDMMEELEALKESIDMEE